MSMQGGNLGTATFYITGNSSGGTNAVNQMNNSLATLEQAATQNWWGLRNLGMAFAALPAAVGAGTAAAIRSAVQWEDAMTGVARTNDLSAEGMERMSNALLDMAKGTPTAATDIAAIAEAAGALGIVGEQNVLQFTKAVQEFSALSGVAADTAATSVARLASLTGVSGAAFDNLTSSIVNAGVNTAATEADILSLGTRVAGVSGIVGISAHEIVGWSAAIRSAGIQSEAGGTAFQKTFLDMNQAVRTNGDEIAVWAELAGTSVEKFRATFENNASDALLQVITNMGRLDAAGVNVIDMLSDLGITEQRQVRLLLTLAQAQAQNANQNMKASEALRFARDGMFDTSTAAAALEARANTVSGQLGILRNILFAAGAGFGEMFLPAIKTVVEYLGYFVEGLQNAPAPVRAIFIVLTGLMTILSGLAAVAFLVGPRILLMTNTIRNLGTGSYGAAAGMNVLTQATRNNAIATGQAVLNTRALNQQLTAQQRLALRTAVTSGNAAAANSVLGGSALAAGAGAAGAGAGISKFIVWLGRLWKWAAIIIGVLSVLAAALAIFGKGSSAQAKSAKAAEGPNTKLTKALMDQSAAAKGAGDQWIKTQKGYKSAAETAKNLGIQQDQLLSIIKGTGHTADAQAAINKLAKAQNGGNKSAGEAIETLQRLNKTYGASAQEAAALGAMSDQAGTNIGELGEDSEKAGKAAKQAAKAHNELRDALEGIAQAHADYISAILSAAQANMSLKESEENLKDARETLARNDERIAAAERNLADARDRHQSAIEAIADAEEKLGTARARQEEAVANSIDALADAQDKYQDTLEKVSDIEKELDKVRRGPTLQEILKATNDLRRAQQNLRESTQDVADAEWQLQHLREEGASARDILDAESALEDARLKVSEGQEALTDSEKELAELRDESARAKKILDLERDLASARRDVEQAARDIITRERELDKARKDAGSNRLVIEAERDLEKARRDVASSSQAVIDAQRELDDTRDNTDLVRDVQRAEEDLKRALFDVAVANTEVRKQQALMNGETWDAGRAASTLAEELGKVIENVPDKAVTGQLQEFMKTLADAPDVPKMVKEMEDALGGGGGGGGFPGAIQGALDGLEGMEFQMPNMELEWPDKMGLDLGISLKDLVWKAISGIGGFLIGRAVGALITSAIASSTGAAAGGALGSFAGPLGTIAGIIIGLLVGYLIEKAGPKVLEVGRSIVDGIWQGIQDAWDGFVRLLWGFVNKGIIDTFKEILGIHSPSTVFKEFGKDIIQGLINGIGEMIQNLVRKVEEVITSLKNKFSDAKNWLLTRGREVLEGLWNGIVGGKEWLLNLIGGIPGWIKDKLVGIGNSVVGRGNDILGGLWQGVLNAKDWLLERLGGVGSWVKEAFRGASDWLIQGGRNIINGLWEGLKDRFNNFFKGAWNGLIQKIPGGFADGLKIESPSKVMMELGGYVSEGVTEGIEKEFRNTLLTVGDLASTLTDQMAKDLDAGMGQFSPFGIDAFTGSGAAALARAGGSSTATSGGVTNNYYETLNLDAITTADPEEIVNSYVWAKRVRVRA